MSNLVGYIIPDTQAKEGVRNPLIPIARHIADIKPHKVIHLGDHYDLPSLSRYDKGKRSHRARTFLKDRQAGKNAMDEFWSELKRLWPNYRRKTDFVLLTGNHEDRLNRALEYGPDELIDLIEQFPLCFKGWNVIPFLKIYKWRGIEFCHYFRQPTSDRPISSARHLLMKRHVSCIAGHKQGFEYEEMMSGSKKIIQAVIAGSCYFHNEGYMTHNNHHWRGSLVITNTNGDGEFDFERHSLNALAKRYK